MPVAEHANEVEIGAVPLTDANEADAIFDL